MANLFERVSFHLISRYEYKSDWNLFNSHVNCWTFHETFCWMKGHQLSSSPGELWNFYHGKNKHAHYTDVIMGAIAFQITSVTIVYSAVYSGANQRKHQRSASLAFVWGIHRGPVNSPHKWPVTRKIFPFDDVIMKYVNMGSVLYSRCIYTFVFL